MDIPELLDGPDNLLIIGPGGCGKSFFIKDLSKHLDRVNIKYAITAATGVAAVNVNGTTLHRFFGVGLCKGTIEQILGHVKKNKNTVVNIRETEILIIDEISMVGAELFNKLNSVAKFIRRNDKPFGGMKLIVAGDFLQLPPVKDEWIFKGELWNTMQFKAIVMNDPKRFTDKNFYETLMRVRKGNLNAADLSKIAERMAAYNHYKEHNEDYQVKPTILYSLKCDVDAINGEEMHKLSSKDFHYQAVDTFVPLDAKVTKEYYKTVLDDLAPEKLIFRVGAQVMITRNLDVTNGLCNGTRAVITNLSPEIITIKTCNNQEIHLSPVPFTFEDKRGKVTRTQFPLILAFALTIHKSQGSTLDSCIIDLGPEIFTAGQAYVALSRARNWNSVYISAFHKKSIKADKYALEYLAHLGC